MDTPTTDPFANLTPVERDALAYRWLLKDWYDNGGENCYLRCTAVTDAAEFDAKIWNDISEDPGATALLPVR